MEYRNEIKQQILHFQMSYKPFAYLIELDDSNTLWIILIFEYTENQSLLINNEISPAEWLSKCNYHTKKCFINNKYFDLENQIISKTEKIPMSSLDDLIDYLLQIGVDANKIRVSL